MPEPTSPDLRSLFRRTPVMSMPQLLQAVAPRSRRSLFRDLGSLGYLSSYSHTGRYYTLSSIAEFDADGLWRYQGIGFSRDGTLKSTVRRLVEVSNAGRTQRELALRLEVRVHNPLLELLVSKQVGRESIESEYVYVSAKRAHAAAQLARRRVELAARANVPQPSLEVEVLLEVIRGARLAEPDAARLAAQLEMRGIRANVIDVAAVLERHGLKKTPPSRSRRSRR
ncbi:MAG TPA: hypothetical protein VMJ65_14695 [Solirubrobacteraceae bacterium]|nr:hypothetical protein [Solirubrobacteraceae bacterium]